ncbi:MAG: ribosome maturation factor RimP [Spirochaetes bacterium]|nr:ribosome maturation factor RimP [Spirochaetota bacterium]
MKRNDTIDKIIQNVAHDLGYSIYDSVLVLHGKTPRITVKIDHINGISHSDCEKFSKELSHRLDMEDVLDDYILEISSPGIKRELRTIDDYIRFMGSPVKGIYNQDNVRKTFKGTLSSVNGEIVTINESNKVLTLTYNQIIKANLDY